MRILCTGSHGFVGRAFCKHYLDQGHTVVGIDSMLSGVPHEDWMFQPNDKTKFQQMFCDCRSFFANPPTPFWGPQSFDLIIHCAAVVGGRIKIEEDPLAVATDLAIDAEFFNWAVRKKPTPKVVYFSSSAVYPLQFQQRDHYVPLRESMVKFDGDVFGKPDMTYGFAKLAGEYLARFAVQQYDLDVKIYRPFGGYGEDQSPDYPFPSIIKRVVDKHNPIMVWGSGEQERDFIHISDVVGAVLATVDALPPGEVMNLGSGQATSFFELAEMTAEQAKHDAGVVNDPNKPEGVFSRVADPTRMLKWYRPKVSLREGIQRALDRHKAVV